MRRATRVPECYLRRMRCLALLVLVAACSSTEDPPGLQGSSSGGGSSSGSSGGSSSSGASSDAGIDVNVAPPTKQGCIDDVSAGTHTYTCDGLRVDASIPEACLRPGCGLILEIHGDTGTGLLMDAHTNLFALGKQKNYVVIAPTGRPYGGGQPGSTWTQQEDPKLLTMTRLFASVFRVDDKKVHATGFSRGGFVAWRMLCDGADLFASVAPSAAGSGNGEVTCFQNGRAPSRKADILFLMGRTDSPVPYPTMAAIRDAAIANYQGQNKQVVASDAQYTHNRWTTAAGVVIETFDHAYETVPNGPWGDAKGHCFPGSKMDPFAPQYAVPCRGPNAFTWGDEVMKFFETHPKK